MPITSEESTVDTTFASTTTATTSPAATTIQTDPTTAAPIAPTTVASTQPDSRPLALDVLAAIPVMRERGDGYDRDLFEHWITIGGCSTRENVLIRDSLTPAQVDPFGCRVVAGDWVSPYDGATWDDPSDVDIDHVVALKEAWDSGAWSWSAAQRRAFANDVTDRRSLRAVTDEVNQSKGDKDPSNWLPSLVSARCPYLADWVALKARWQLSMDESEAGRIRNLLTRDCPGLRIEPWSSPPVSITPASAQPAETIAVAPAAPTTLAPPPSAAGASVYFANCSAARAAGAAPLMRGEPGYREAMDRDKDGIACE
ncbi:MAG: excalibur calcium-binding domain-containing protein [Actinomycetota bacterium]